MHQDRVEHSDTDMTDSSQCFGFLEIGKQRLLHDMTGVSAGFPLPWLPQQWEPGNLGRTHWGQVVSLFGAFNSFLLKH